MEQDNKMEKVLAESKSNPAIDKTIKLKKKKDKKTAQESRRQPKY